MGNKLSTPPISIGGTPSQNVTECNISGKDIITVIAITHKLLNIIPNDVAVIFIGQSANWFYHIAMKLSELKKIPETITLIGLPLSGAGITGDGENVTNIKNMCNYIKSKIDKVNLDKIYLMDFSISGGTIKYVYNEIKSCLGDAYELNLIFIYTRLDSRPTASWDGRYINDDMYDIIKNEYVVNVSYPLGYKLVMNEKHNIPRTIVKYTTQMWKDSLPPVNTIPDQSIPCVETLRSITKAMYTFETNDYSLDLMGKIIGLDEWSDNWKDKINEMLEKINNPETPYISKY